MERESDACACVCDTRCVSRRGARCAHERMSRAGPSPPVTLPRVEQPLSFFMLRMACFLVYSWVESESGNAGHPPRPAAPRGGGGRGGGRAPGGGGPARAARPYRKIEPCGAWETSAKTINGY